MISYRWRPELDAEELEQVTALIGAAAGYDAEAGFATVDAKMPGQRSHGAIRIAHLPVRARRDLSVHVDAPWVTVAYLHLRVDPEGQGVAHFVVHPDYRSRGVATLLVEELGLDVAAPEGWCGTGARTVRAWAYGTHPATERLAARFGIAAVDRRWTLVRHLRGPWATPLDDVDARHGIPESSPADGWAGAAEFASVLPDARAAAAVAGPGRVLAVRDAYGPAAVVRFDTRTVPYGEFRGAWIQIAAVAPRAAGRGLGSGLITQALGEMRDAGAQVALIRVDPAEDRAVRMLRLMSFEQEETHTQFAIGNT
ncbi:GNAT family N-acetyltransferase [Nocardia carnea]|uniref:GNAT family N-acetyltransferase n=1 Tax=Nocardia carnea TaxID=37328 RepID=UPI002453F47B|nr:GNAT family N-acetyltransferase [Nocardia carnea]